MNRAREPGSAVATREARFHLNDPWKADEVSSQASSESLGTMELQFHGYFGEDTEFVKGERGKCPSFPVLEKPRTLVHRQDEERAFAKGQ